MVELASERHFDQDRASQAGRKWWARELRYMWAMKGTRVIYGMSNRDARWLPSAW